MRCIFHTNKVEEKVCFERPVSCNSLDLDSHIRAQSDQLGRISSSDTEFRTFPPPFKGFVSICSDADSCDLEGALNTADTIRNKYGLPISDSYFPEWFYKFHTTSKGKGKLHAWLREYHNGAFDTVHGWLLRLLIKIGDDERFVFNRQEIFLRKIIGRALSRLLNMKHPILPMGKKLGFSIPEGWHTKREPRYFYCRYANSNHENFVYILFKVDDVPLAVIPIHFVDVATLKPVPIVIDLRKSVTEDVEVLKRLEAEILIYPVRPSIIEISRPTLVSDLRGNIIEQDNLLRRYNIRSTVYTSHGGGYSIGNCTAPDIDSMDDRGMSELSTNPQYAMDIFRSHGINFFNTASNTCTDTLNSIRDLVFPFTLNNGELVYDFFRYNIPVDDQYPASDPISRPYNPSLSEFVGYQIDSAVKAISDDSGALIYTHLMAKHPSNPKRTDRSKKGLFNEAAHTSLRNLSKMYHCLETYQENTPPLIAPVSCLLRYSQVIRNIDKFCSYQSINNTVYINSWTDPVTKARLPTDLSYPRELRWVTVYVDNAETARVRINNRDCNAVIRNPVDETGRESITIADTYTSTPVIGHNCRWLLDNNRLEVSGGTVNTINGDAGLSILCSDIKCVIKINISNLNLSHHQNISWFFNQASEDMRYAIKLASDRGYEYIAGSNTFGCSAILSSKHDNGENLYSRQVIIPLRRILDKPDISCNSLPGGNVAAITLQISGKPGDIFNLYWLSLYRDDDKPEDKEGLLVGGLVNNSKKIHKVLMEVNGNQYITPVNEDGDYLFPDKIKRGSIVKILGMTSDLDYIQSDEGPVIELKRNRLDIDFS